MFRDRPRLAAAMMLPGLLLPMAASAQCQFEWDTQFGVPGTAPLAEVNAMCVYDDGTGPALHIAGFIQFMDGSMVQSVAKWDTAAGRWVALGGGLSDSGSFNPGRVRDLCVFDPDGAGPQRPLLIAVGNFDTSDGADFSLGGVAAWDGTSWSSLGGGVYADNIAFVRDVYTCEVHDYGTGPRLFIGGIFSVPGGAYFAEWTGSQWGPPGASPTGYVFALKSYDDGSGSKLYVGGQFDSIGIDSALARTARWTGSAWEPVGPFPYNYLGNFEAFDPDGAGPAPNKLYAAGQGALAAWDGSSWAAVSPGATATGLTVHNDGSGNALYFVQSPTLGDSPDIKKWDGTTVTTIGGVVHGGLGDGQLVGNVYSLLSFNSGDGAKLYVGGYFLGIDNAWVPGIVRRSGATWEPVSHEGGFGYMNITDPSFSPQGFGPFTRGTVYDADGAGPGSPALVVAGNFNRVAGQLVHGVVSWNGSAWTELAGGFPSAQVGRPTEDMTALTAMSTPTGQDLFVGVALHGTTTVFGSEGYGVYKLTGSSWSPVGAPLSFAGTASSVAGQIFSLVPYNSGSGNELYAGGRFASIDGVTVNQVAKWNGTAWAPLGSGVSGAFSAEVSTMVTHDDGSGEKLYVSGFFNSASGTPVHNLAAWNGSSWSNVGSGPTGGGTDLVSIRTGPAAGLYTTNHSSVERWDGASWSNITPAGPYERMNLLGSFDDGSGLKLYAAGYDTISATGSLVGGKLVVWDGAFWNEVPDSFFSFDMPTQILSFPTNGQTSAYFLGGSFKGVGGTSINPLFTLNATGSPGFARWFCPTVACPADFNHSGAVTVQDIFDFLGAYFSNNPNADINHSGTVTVQDIFDYLSAYFTGC